MYHNVTQSRSVRSLAVMFLQRFPVTYVLRAQEAVFWSWIFIQSMWCPKMFWNLSVINLLQSGDGPSAERLVEDLDILWASVKVVKRWFQHWFESWWHPLQIFCRQERKNVPRWTGKETIQSKSRQLNASFYPRWKDEFSGVVLTERERKDRFEHGAKNQTPVFQSGTFLLQKETRKGIKLTWNIWQSHETAYDGQHSIRSSWFFSGRCINNQRVCM